MKLKKQITTTIVLLIYLFSITPLFAISANNTYYKDENGEIVEQKNYEKTGCRGSSLFLDFGARYLDSKYSRWLSTDPALQSYIPQGNSSQEDKAKEISQLPGMGGIYNTINSHLYHYAGNNPVRYVDPDGREILSTKIWYNHFYQQDIKGNWPNSTDSIYNTGCTLVTAERAFNRAYNEFFKFGDSRKYAEMVNMLYDENVTSSEGMNFLGLENYFSKHGLKAEVTDITTNFSEVLENLHYSEDKYLVIGKIRNEQHYINVDSYDVKSKTYSGTDSSKKNRNLENISTIELDRIILIKVELEEN